MNINEIGRELNIDEIHQKICNLMVFFHEFCEKHQIRYFVSYGSLIGVIRHKGFIPWDDDFDVQMPREDLNRFLELFNEEYIDSKIYKVCTRANTKNYSYGIPRLCDQRFKFVYQDASVLSFEQGIFIDIYPLDNFGDTIEECEALKNEIRRINREFEIYINGKSSSNILKTPIKFLYHKFLNAKYGENYPMEIDAKIYDIIKSKTNPNNRFIGVICWDQKLVSYEKFWFEDRILADFDHYKFWIPEHYDNILRASYGDYMRLPPENQRVMTHNYKIYEKPKSEYED